jgi:methionyl-tRNA formyltransferase
MPIFKRIKDNCIKVDTLSKFYNEIRMRDEDGQPLGYIDYGKFRIEFRRASLRRDYVEADVKIVRK